MAGDVLMEQLFTLGNFPEVFTGPGNPARAGIHLNCVLTTVAKGRILI